MVDRDARTMLRWKEQIARDDLIGMMGDWTKFEEPEENENETKCTTQAPSNLSTSPMTPEHMGGGSNPALGGHSGRVTAAVQLFHPFCPYRV